MFKYLFIIAFLACCAVMATTNPQQQVCARPDPLKGGCSSQRRPTSCINWHGCKWSCGLNDKKCTLTPETICIDRTCCTDDLNCLTKPTLVPTLQPTPPTNSPTASPTIPCKQPVGGCGTQLSAGSCAQWNGCYFHPVGLICQSGGCAPPPPATPAPTACTDLPTSPLGCASQVTIPQCSRWTCCKWLGGTAAEGGKCYGSGFTGNIPCKNYGKNLVDCRKQTNCKVVNGACAPK